MTKVTGADRKLQELNIFHDVAKALTSSLDLDSILYPLDARIAPCGLRALRTRLGFPEVNTHCTPGGELLGNFDEQETVAATDVEYFRSARNGPRNFQRHVISTADLAPAAFTRHTAGESMRNARGNVAALIRRNVGNTRRNDSGSSVHVSYYSNHDAGFVSEDLRLNRMKLLIARDYPDG